MTEKVEIGKKEPPRIELGFVASKATVIAVTPWLRKGGFDSCGA
jgi:hypothetical protein